jgi:hypothetical protein
MLCEFLKLLSFIQTDVPTCKSGEDLNIMRFLEEYSVSAPSQCMWTTASCTLYSRFVSLPPAGSGCVGATTLREMFAINFLISEEAYNVALYLGHIQLPRLTTPKSNQCFSNC